MKKFIAVGLIAAGLVIGGSATAHAATASQYVTVLWSYDGYPDITKPQAFVNSYAGADLHAFDATLAQADSCGHPFQADVYKLTDEHGTSWETLKATGALQYAHDGGFLAYNAGIGTPYRVITPEEYPCTIPTPEPSPTTTPSSPEPSTPASGTPSASPSTTPSGGPTVTPSASPTPTSSPTPNGPSPTPSAVASSTPTPTSSPTVTATPSPTASVPSSTPNGSPSASRTAELAYTGANPWPGIGAASVLIAAGIGLLIARRVRRG